MNLVLLPALILWVGIAWSIARSFLANSGPPPWPEPEPEPEPEPVLGASDQLDVERSGSGSGSGVDPRGKRGAAPDADRRVVDLPPVV